jgi:hypothetical protein
MSLLYLKRVVKIFLVMLSTQRRKNIYNNNNKSHAMHAMIMTSKTIEIILISAERRDLLHFGRIDEEIKKANDL